MDASDTALIEECAELSDFLASYETGCQLLIEAECGSEPEVEEARRRLLDAGQQWRASLRRVAQRPAHAVPALLAKGLTLHALLAVWATEDAEIALLARSVVADLIRLLPAYA